MTTKVWVGDITITPMADVKAAMVWSNLLCRKDGSEDVELGIPGVMPGDIISSELVNALIENTMSESWVRLLLKEWGLMTDWTLEDPPPLGWVLVELTKLLNRIRVEVMDRTWVGTGEMEISVRLSPAQG